MFDTKRIALPTSPVLRPSGRTQYQREWICLVVSLAILGQMYLALQYCSVTLLPWNRDDHSANSTLGFGGIYAVSRRGSPRRHSLLSAGSLTGLDITIPTQPMWTDEHVAQIRAPENSFLDRGSALAWLGHRNALEKFLKSTDDTALIMEDDVDWDTRLRTQQIPQTAFAIRELLDSHNGYFGDTDFWDIIWLGHCGDYFNASKGSQISAIKSYNDPAMPDLTELHPWTRDFLEEIGADQNRQRLVHVSVQPLCTFAYAITRKAAEKVLNELTVREPNRGPESPCRAYDVRLLEGCRDEGMRCISVNPELFHHSDLGSEVALASNNRPVEDGETSSQRRLVESPTTNIRCSARSRKWKEIQDSVTDPGINAEEFVRNLAELSAECYIDDM